MSTHDMAEATGMTAVQLAAENGDARLLKSLLTHAPSPEEEVRASDDKGITALMFAVSRGHTDCAHVLLEHLPAVQIHAANKLGVTPLQHAVWTGHVDCIEALLLHMPDEQIMACDDRGRTALMYATWKCDPQAIGMLLTHAPKAQVKASSRDGRTALMSAAYVGRADCLELLLAHAADDQVKATDSGGWTALMHAADGKCDARCITILVARGSPLPADAKMLEKIQPAIMSMAQTVRVPILLNQAIAHAIPTVMSLSNSTTCT